MDRHATHHSTPAAVTPPPFTPSIFQQAVFDHITDPANGNLVIEAVAGSGKTSTIVQAIHMLPAGATSLFLAFNKSIAEELRTRGVNGSTFHSLALTGLRPRLDKGFKIEGSKVAGIFRAIVHKDLLDDYAELPRLVSLGKNYGIGVFADLPNKAENWETLIEYHDLTFPNNDKACDFARRILDISNDDLTKIDFDDMLYLNLLLRAPMSPYDFVFIDEAQDTNGVQLALIDKIVAATDLKCRLIFVGDRHQAIYGFRGAGTDSMDIIKHRFRADALPLSISYRCPKDVVAFAKQFVPQIESAETARQGCVAYPDEWALSDVPSSAVILCRNTKPIIRLAYTFLRNGRRVQVIGRDIGTGFKAILKLCKASTLEDVIKRVEMRQASEVEAAVRKNQPGKAAAIEDKFDSLLFILDTLDMDRAAYFPPETIVKTIGVEIDKLFAANPGAVQFSTVHKAKGMEWQDVYLLDYSTLMPSKWAKEGWQIQQEHNLIYVAVTRAKQNLTFIDSRTLSVDDIL